MFKLITIIAISMGALLIAPLAMERSMPVRSCSRPTSEVRLPPQRVLTLTGEFHARLLMSACLKLKTAGSLPVADRGNRQSVAWDQNGLRPDRARAR